MLLYESIFQTVCRCYCLIYCALFYIAQLAVLDPFKRIIGICVEFVTLGVPPPCPSLAPSYSMRLDLMTPAQQALHF